MNKTLQVVLAFLGIFLMGAVAGGFVGARLVMKQAVQHKAVDQFTIQQMRKYGDQLQLTREQREKIRPIIMRTGSEVGELRQDVAEALDRMDKEIKTQLTPDQQVKFEGIRAEQGERERRWQKWVQEQRKLRDMRNLDQMAAPAQPPPR